MLTLTVLDTVDADSVEVNDYIDVDGIVGQVVDTDDQGDIIVITLRNDSDGEIEDYPLFASDSVNLLTLA